MKSNDLDLVEPGLAMFRGFANIAFVFGHGELLVVDTGNPGTGANALKAIRRTTQEPITLIIYTHGHHDHFSDTRCFLEDAASRGHLRPDIWSHERLPPHLHRSIYLAGWQAMINSLQFDTDIAPDDVADRRNYVFPDFTYSEHQTLDLSGEPIELYHALGETDDASWIWLPERQAALVGDLIISSMPNAGNPTKPQRFALEWAKALERIAAKEPRFVLPGHGPVYRGAACLELLRDTAHTLRFIHDEVVGRLNDGQWPVAILEAGIRLPRSLENKPYLREIYGCVPFIVHDVLRTYAGWWSGQPSELFPPSRRQHAEDVVELCGREALLLRARNLLQRGEYERAVALAELVSNADLHDREARRTFADTVEGLAESMTSHIARNLLRGTAANLLRR